MRRNAPRDQRQLSSRFNFAPNLTAHTARASPRVHRIELNMTNGFASWIKERGIGEVECLIPDLNGVIRGKVFPAQKFLQSERDASLRIPSSVYSLTVTGEYSDDADEAIAMKDPDVVLRPDLDTICVAPGYKTPTAFVFADAYHTGGEPYDIAPRYVLKRVMKLYEEMGVRPVVAPELEFYLTQINTDPDLPLLPPAGRSGRSETAPQPYGLEAITEYEDLIETIYEHAEAASLHLDTMIHESGTAQLEINFNHGDPVHVSDQVLVFKRIVRQVALKHGVYATFMAKPMENQPGSAMHLHTSLVDAKKGDNLFAGAGDGNSDMFNYFVGGLQKYLGLVTAAVCPKCELVPPHASGFLRASECAMGLRQSLVRFARANLASGQPPCREPSAGR